MKKEIEYLKGVVSNPVRPFVAILGGAKVSGKIGVLENLSDKVDKVIVGGGMAFTFIKAMGYEVGDSMVEPDMLGLAEKIRDKLRKNNVKFYLPVDVVIAQSTDPGPRRRSCPSQEIPRGWRALDIGPASVKLFSGRARKRKDRALERPDGPVRGRRVLARDVRGGALGGRRIRAYDRRRRGHGPCGSPRRRLGLDLVHLDRGRSVASAA